MLEMLVLTGAIEPAAAKVKFAGVTLAGQGYVGAGYLVVTCRGCCATPCG